MRPKLLETALEEAMKFGPAARLLLTFNGGEDSVQLHPLAYERVEESGFRIEMRVSQFDDAELVDDVLFVDANSVESAELQVKQKGAVWKDEPYPDVEQEEDEGPG